MESMQLTSRIISGHENALDAVKALANRSAWFSFEPLPDDKYEIQFKPDEGIEAEIDACFMLAQSMLEPGTVIIEYETIDGVEQ